MKRSLAFTNHKHNFKKGLKETYYGIKNIILNDMKLSIPHINKTDIQMLAIL